MRGMGCGCGNCGGRGLGALQVTVDCPNCPAPGDAQYYVNSSGQVQYGADPTYGWAEYQRCLAAHNLCLARRELAQGNYGAAAWDRLKSLENDFSRIWNNPYHSIFNLVHVPLPKWLGDLISALADAIMKFLDWLRQTLTPWILAIAGVVMIVHGVGNEIEQRDKAA